MKIKLNPSLNRVKMIMKIIFIVIVMVLEPFVRVHAQFFEEISNPKITLTLSHPPDIGFLVNKIAFGPSAGNCADQVVARLISDFTNSNMEVVDRENLMTLLGEHHFTMSGFVDKTSAAAIGKILGPSALIFVKVQRCEAKQAQYLKKETRYNENKKHTDTLPAYVSKTSAFLNASLQTVDLVTGRIFAARTFEYSQEKTNKSFDGYPDYPAEFILQDTNIARLVREVHRMFLPWTENRALTFYDDKKCDLKLAYNALKAGDMEEAFRISKQNLAACDKTADVKDKLKAHANYNLGMCYMLRNDYDNALVYFRIASKLHSGYIVSNAIGDCQRANDLAIALQMMDETASIEADKNQAETDRRIKEEAANILTNDNIIELSVKKIPKSVILQKIKSSKCNFDTSTEALVGLNNKGVSEDVISAMIEKGD